MNTVSTLIRSDLGTMQPYNSGLSIAEIQKRYQVSSIAKLGSNENPFGPAPEVFGELDAAASSIFLYPESDAGRLRSVVAQYYKVPEERLIFGNGSEELLSIISRSIVNPSDRIVTLFPSFPLHEDYAVMMGGVIDRVSIKADLTIDVGALIEAVRKPSKMVVFANPMNPVGAWLNPKELEEIIQETHPDSLLVVDEAYFEYAQSGAYCSALEFLETSRQNWMVLRTFSKAWGLAGLRVGFAVCSDPVLRSALDLTRTPFNTNSLAQRAAVKAIEQSSYMKKNVAITLDEKKRVEAEMDGLDIQYAASLGNFLFFDCKRNASGVATELLKTGTIVKPWRQSGFERFIRVSVGKSFENDQFLQDFRRVYFENTRG